MAVAGLREIEHVERPDASDEIVVRAFCRDDLPAAAARRCRERFPDGRWQLGEPVVRPCMTSLAGRVRLWEGRFEVRGR